MQILSFLCYFIEIAMTSSSSIFPIKIVLSKLRFIRTELRDVLAEVDNFSTDTDRPISSF